ncbi:MAG: hypothetical protein ABEJ72_07330, partial [Candidatus Aenigmatarchaeota archaeon]
MIETEEDDKLRSKPFLFYKYRLYPRARRLRGGYRLYNFLARLASTGIEKIPESQTETIFDRGDWDNLLILDACRYDLYQEVSEKENL